MNPPTLGFPMDLAAWPDDQACDVLVLGAGGAGMAAALCAAIDGARVLLVESTGQVGGTTAFSAGTTWIPGTTVGAQVNPQDSAAQALTFLDAAVGERSPRALREAFVAQGPAAVAHLQAHSHLQFRARPFHPDYLSELPGSTACGRALEPQPFDGRLLGEHLALVRPPPPEFTVLGGMQADRDDIPHLLGWHRSAASFAYSLRILGRHAADRLRHPRGTRMLMGNALVGRLLLSLRERGVGLLLHTTATAVQAGGDGGHVVTLQQGGHSRRVPVRGGVILASGGFNRHAQRRAQRLPGIPPQWCAGAPGHEGAAHAMFEALGAHYGPTGQSDAFWAPVSTRVRADGSVAVFPHFVFDRAKPHMLTVNARGERYLNESTSYHLFGQAMQAAHRQSPSIPSWLITDAQGMRKYGLGMVRPKGMGLRAALADSYVQSAPTLEALAAQLKLPPAALRATVERFNQHAACGVDADFQRGTTLYQRANGDATWGGPNPSLGPLTQAPFYALQLVPGDIGAATGFVCDAQARMLDAQGRPLPGLYACGNDMHSVMGGVYPAPGITIGPGLVFACLAARHAVARLRAQPVAQAA